MEEMGLAVVWSPALTSPWCFASWNEPSSPSSRFFFSEASYHSRGTEIRTDSHLSHLYCGRPWLPKDLTLITTFAFHRNNSTRQRRQCHSHFQVRKWRHHKAKWLFNAIQESGRREAIPKFNRSGAATESDSTLTAEVLKPENDLSPFVNNILSL